MTLGGPKTPANGATARPASPGTPAIDRAVLGEWLADDHAAINELLAVFRDSITTEQDKMTELLASGDLDAYASAAHRLRGAALSMGARVLAELAGILYASARADDDVACRNGMTALRAQIDLVIAEIPGTT